MSGRYPNPAEPIDLSAEIRRFQVRIGTALLPAVTKIAEAMAGLVEAMEPIMEARRQYELATVGTLHYIDYSIW